MMKQGHDVESARGIEMEDSRGTLIDISLELLSVCVVDGRGKIVKEAKVASEPKFAADRDRQKGHVPSTARPLERDDKRELLSMREQRPGRVYHAGAAVARLSHDLVVGRRPVGILRPDRDGVASASGRRRRCKEAPAAAIGSLAAPEFAVG
jgi:hypothetical protein